MLSNVIVFLALLTSPAFAATSYQTLDCVRLLTGDSELTLEDRIVNVYSELINRVGQGNVSTSELEAVLKNSEQNPELLLSVFEGGDSERETLREGLKKIHEVILEKVENKEAIYKKLRAVLEKTVGGHKTEDVAQKKIVEAVSWFYREAKELTDLSCVVMSANGRVVIGESLKTGGWLWDLAKRDAPIKIWDKRTGARSISSDGKYVAIERDEPTVHKIEIFSVDEKAVVHELELPLSVKKEVSWVSFASGTHYLMSWHGLNKNEAKAKSRIWDADTGKLVKEFSGYRLHRDAFGYNKNGFVFLKWAKGTDQFDANKGQAIVFNPLTKKKLHQLELSGSLGEVMFSPDALWMGARLLVKTEIEWTNLETGEGFVMNAHGFEFSPTEAAIFVASSEYVNHMRQYTIEKTSLSTGEVLASIKLKINVGVSGMAVSPLGNVIAIGTNEGLYLWDVKTQDLRKLTDLDVQNLRFVSEHEIAAYHDRAYLFRTWNTEIETQ